MSPGEDKGKHPGWGFQNLSNKQKIWARSFSSTGRRRCETHGVLTDLPSLHKM